MRMKSLVANERLLNKLITAATDGSKSVAVPVCICVLVATPCFAAAPKPTFDRSYSTAINDRAVARLKVTVPDDFGTTLPTMNVLAIKNKVRNSPPLSP